MLMNVSYDYESGRIGIPCPNCASDVEYDVPAIIDAINLGNLIQCDDCKHIFGIDLELLDPRSPTLRAPVHAEQKCPACDGMGEINPWGTYYTCPECNGTGISNRSAGG